MLDTGFLITLFDKNRPHHDDSYQYFRHFLEKDFEMLISTVVVAEYSVKQHFDQLPLKHFTILPFNYDDAICCAGLVAGYHGVLRPENVKRDAVKDDFKIIAQAQQIKADFLITEDENSMTVYCRKLREENQLATKVVPISIGFDVSCVNDDGQMELTDP